MKDHDETTALLGHWGHFQQIVFFLLCASTIPSGAGVLSVIFVADIHSHHCMVPEFNLSQDWHNAIIPIQVNDCTIGNFELCRYIAFLNSVYARSELVHTHGVVRPR